MFRMREARFCEGCLLGNGVNEISETFYHNMQFVDPNPGFQLVLADKADSKLNSLPITVTVPGDIDSTIPKGTFDAIVDKVRNCDRPTDLRIARLGGLLGHRMVTACGAFPTQAPNRVKVRGQDTGWFHPDEW
jgi:hypothetical protein